MISGSRISIFVRRRIHRGSAKVFSYRSVVVCLLFLAGCTTLPSRPRRTVVETQVAIVPARIVGNFFLIESRQDDGRVRRFLIDTGSTATIVSPELAAALRLKEKRPAQRGKVHVRGADGADLELPAATLRRLWIGQAKFEKVAVLVFNFADLSSHLGLPVDGIIGFPLFHGALLTLDYPGSRLVVAPSPAASAAPGQAERTSTLAFNDEQGTPLIPVQLGNESFYALIDSGSDGPLTLNPAGLHPRFLSGPRVGSLVASLGGNRPQTTGRLAQDLLLGSHIIEQPVVDLTDQLSSIGGEFLRHFSVTFDQRRRLVTFVRDAAGPVKMEARRSSGLSFGRSPAYWRVLQVVPDTPAATLPVQVGDLCVRINGEPVAKWDQERFGALLRTAAKITFTFLASATERDVEVPVCELVP